MKVQESNTQREERKSKERNIVSVQFSRSVMSDSLWPHGLQHTRLPCTSLTPRVYSTSCPSCWWCHLTISSSVVPFSSHLQSFPASGSPGQNTGMVSLSLLQGIFPTQGSNAGLPRWRRILYQLSHFNIWDPVKTDRLDFSHLLDFF